MTTTIKFLGAAGSVTGSKYLVEFAGKRILIDAGMFQGRRELRERNWNDPEVPLNSIDAVILTHAHIDHTGILPRYSSLGLKCPVYCSKATFDLAKILLPDAGYLQEEEANYRRRKKKSRHKPPLPLYTKKDSIECLSLFKTVPFDKSVEIFPKCKLTLRRAGHIIGAAHLVLEIDGKIINFSGDIGRYGVPILVDPQPVEFGDLLLIESTYGGRNHPESDPMTKIAEVINETHERGGTLIIPSFAVGRAQLLLYYIRELKESGKIPNLPVAVDSPMATDATGIYRDNPSEYDDDSLGIISRGSKPFSFDKLAFVQDASASKRLNKIKEPMIIISASGMLYGGRVLHHLKNRIDNPKNSVLFVGYQPPGSRGERIKSGADSIRLMGDEVKIRAQISSIGGLSAHADQSELIRWCKSCTGTPKSVAIVHGEPDSAKDLKEKLAEEFGWEATIPDYLETLSL